MGISAITKWSSTIAARYQRRLFGSRRAAMGFLAGSSLLLVAFSLPPKMAQEASDKQQVNLQIPVIKRSVPVLSVAGGDQQAKVVEPPKPAWRRIVVQPGDTLAKLFSRNGLSARTVHEVTHIEGVEGNLANLFPGDELSIILAEDGSLVTLRYDLDETTRVTLTHDGQSYQAETTERVLDRRVVTGRGEIRESLFVAAQEAGLSDALTMELAGIFGWDIDFVLDIRAGDRFSLIYEEVYRDGERLRDGRILAASFTNRGRTFRAVRYDSESQGIDGEYFSPAGENMRKAFLRAPLDFSRISSRFSRNRPHPVLKGVTRPHRGVDYAAPTGTPVRVTGNGKIIHRGRNRGYGNHLIVQHANQYKTVYAHLSKYNRKAKKGSRVKQGQTIGYVGMTGLANGPHLHYEFRVNDRHKNPLTVKLPKAQSLPAPEIPRFEQRTAHLVTQLAATEIVVVAATGL